MTIEIIVNTKPILNKDDHLIPMFIVTFCTVCTQQNFAQKTLDIKVGYFSLTGSAPATTLTSTDVQLGDEECQVKK